MRLLALLIASARALSWDGDYFDPDELKISVSRSAAGILAKSSDWEIAGQLLSENRAKLAGLEGTLSDRGISWSNGVVWLRKRTAAPTQLVSLRLKCSPNSPWYCGSSGKHG